MIRITSKKNNFRRCGIAHPDRAVDYPDDKFTKEELDKLKAEPMLIVEVLDKSQSGAKKESSLTVAQLKERLDILKIKYDPAAKKDDLVTLLLS